MQLYEVTLYDSSEPKWRRTRTEAHELAKTSSSPGQARIALKDYPFDQETFCNLFNGGRPEGKTIKEWILSRRGGLMELGAGETVQPAAEEAGNTDLQSVANDAVQQPGEDPQTFWDRMNAQAKGKKG